MISVDGHSRRGGDARDDPELGEEVGALHTEIRRRRSLGEVWFGVWGRPEGEDWAPREVADRATSALGLGILGASWRELSRSDAHALLALGLREEMAYDTQLMTDEEARALADRFAALFPGDAQFFTNALWTEGKIAGWYEAVASSTFETGVVVVSRTRAGVLWFGDED